MVGAVLFGLSMAGCKDLNEGAREDFSRAHTCPMDRVEARERADIRPSSLRYGEDKPPAEIAADPGRLKMWQDERTKDRQDYDSSNKTFEVRGCGHLTLYACMRHTKNANRAFCSQYAHPPGVAKWP